MKTEVRLLAILGFVFLLIFLSGDIRDTGTAVAQQTDQPKEGLDWIPMDLFENCQDWRANATCPLGDTKTRRKKGNPTEMDGKKIPEEFTKENQKDEKSEYVLGVKTYFMDRGFDRVEVYPPNEYIIKGKAKELTVWVLGRKFRHTLYVKLRDYRGAVHKLKIGRLDFWGWKKMRIIIPGWLPQSTRYAMMDKNLHFVSFFVVSDHYEVPGTFYFYMDNFRILADTTEFTGDKNIEDTW